ncbi:ATP-dependent helicase [Candidatus Pacearchaeota archaeon]|nr:ATP-dependent helicase [Candidatus Pacearchaeota archaeon]
MKVLSVQTLAAIEKSSGPCVILAGAGTGKTHTMVEKVNYLVENKLYSPEKIVCITFSNEAANNIVLRLRRRLNGLQPIVRTFHAFSADLLRMYGDRIGISKEFTILDPDEAKVLLHTHLKILPQNCHRYVGSLGIAKDLGITLEQVQNYLSGKMNGIDNIESKLEQMQFELQTLHLKEGKEKKKQLVEEIKNHKSLIDLKKFASAWGAYEKIKAKKNYQDYADLTVNTILLLKKCPEIAQDFDYFIIDEFQDTNKIQLDFIQEIAPHGNITIVGDLNQSIYRFRGAYKENFNQFKSFFNVKNEDVYTLASSYRSPNTVLRAAHKLISNNYERKEDCFEVQNVHGREGEKVNVYELKNGKEEARKVAELVELELQTGKKASDICIMFRTHQQGRVIKRALDFKGIPYSSVSKKPLFHHTSVRTARDYLSVLNSLIGKKNGSEEAWWNLIHGLNVQDDDFIQIGKFIQKNKEYDNSSALLLSNLDKLPLSTSGRLSMRVLVDRIKQLIPYSSMDVVDLIPHVYRVANLVPEDTSQGREHLLNLNKFLELARNHSALYSPDLGSFLHYLSILESLDIEISSSELEKEGVQLMTLHSTKGLEYKTVIITNMAQKRFPLESFSSSLIPTALLPELRGITDEEMIRNYEIKNNLLEERRLCYVAFTRSSEKLILTYAREYSHTHCFPSSFLDEIKYKENPDLFFSTDEDEKYIEPAPELRPASFYLLSQKNGEELLAQVLKGRSETLGKPSHIVFSPSSLLLFADCPKKYEYKYIYHMPEKKVLSWDSINLGSFVHHVLDCGVKAGFKTLQQYYDLVNELHLKEDWESINVDEAILLIKVFFERNKDKYSKNSKTEQVLTMERAGLHFTGFADRIDFNNDGIEIVDYKTGASVINTVHRNWQLGYYALAAQSLGTVRRITLDMLKQEKPLEFALDDKGNAKAVHSDRMHGFNIYQIEQELIKTAHSILGCYEKGFPACSQDRNCEFCNEMIYGL